MGSNMQEGEVVPIKGGPESQEVQIELQETVPKDDEVLLMENVTLVSNPEPIPTLTPLRLISANIKDLDRIFRKSAHSRFNRVSLMLRVTADLNVLEPKKWVGLMDQYVKILDNDHTYVPELIERAPH